MEPLLGGYINYYCVCVACCKRVPDEFQNIIIVLVNLVIRCVSKK